eukprot:244132-Chlamydomonas_euryale.AAC.7
MRPAPRTLIWSTTRRSVTLVSGFAWGCERATCGLSRERVRACGINPACRPSPGVELPARRWSAGKRRAFVGHCRCHRRGRRGRGMHMTPPRTFQGDRPLALPAAAHPSPWGVPCTPHATDDMLPTLLSAGGAFSIICKRRGKQGWRRGARGHLRPCPDLSDLETTPECKPLAPARSTSGFASTLRGSDRQHINEEKTEGGAAKRVSDAGRGSNALAKVPLGRAHPGRTAEAPLGFLVHTACRSPAIRHICRRTPMHETTTAYQLRGRKGRSTTWCSPKLFDVGHLAIRRRLAAGEAAHASEPIGLRAVMDWRSDLRLSRRTRYKSARMLLKSWCDGADRCCCGRERRTHRGRP